jgi:hypothetical protein
MYSSASGAMFEQSMWKHGNASWQDDYLFAAPAGPAPMIVMLLLNW